MCGRYNIVTNAKALIDAFGVIKENMAALEAYLPQYNIPPTSKNLKQLTHAPIVRNSPQGRRIDMVMWPFIPKWANGQLIKVLGKYSTINAKAENLASSKSYQHAWENNQRCLIPATGFYEWQITQQGGPKQPYHIQIKDQPIFAMAGIWEKSGDIESFAILTTEANQLMAEIHNENKRMPVILKADQIETWLNGSMEEAEKCISQYADDLMIAFKITTAVNNPGFNDPKCVEPIADE